MFTPRKITPTIVAWDCASCGKAMVEASYVLEGVGRTGRPTMVGYVCVACAIWARSWTPPVPSSDPDFGEVEAGVVLADRLTDEEITILRAEKAQPLPMNRVPASPTTAQVLARAAPQGSTRDDEKILVGLRANSSIETIAKILDRDPWEVEARAEVLCPEPRDATTIGAALKRVREAAHG